MARLIRIASTTPSRVQDAKGEGFALGARVHRPIHIRCAGSMALSNAELELVAAAGGVRVGTDPANN
jgi:hypothetical protein